MAEQVSERLGICSWSLHPATPEELVRGVQNLGLKQVQLALSPMSSDPKVWGEAPQRLRDAGICIASGMFGTVGEDYSTLETIRRTGGFLPDEHWEQNHRIAADIAKIAREEQISLVSVHAGFIPHDKADRAYEQMLQRLGTVADLFAEHDLTLLFETGQETADDLLAFLDDLGRDNVGVNFDPANMILYDKGEPIEALRKLLPRVKQVHIKDAVRTETPGTWGTEVPIGEGEVDWPAFIRTLRDGGYDGALIIEREAGDDRAADVRKAIARLSELL